MSLTQSQLNARLLQCLGLSAESAAVVMEEIDRLNAELAHEKEASKAYKGIATLWDSVGDHILSHSEAVLGQSAPETALAWLRERDALKSQAKALQAKPEFVPCPVCPDGPMCRDLRSCLRKVSR